MKYKLLIFSLVFILLAGCAQQETITEEPMMEEETMMGEEAMMEDMSEEEMEAMMEEEMEDIEVMMEETSMSDDWKDVTLKNVLTGESFKISDFKGKPVLLESFAVWCPICRKQQEEIKKLHSQVGDSVISISLDTDPNEDEQKVVEHVNRYGFDWRFAVSPKELTKALIDEFGVPVVNAPSAPVVLICEDQSVRFLENGVKSADELKSEIERGC